MKLICFRGEWSKNSIAERDSALIINLKNWVFKECSPLLIDVINATTDWICRWTPSQTKIRRIHQNFKIVRTNKRNKLLASRRERTTEVMRAFRRKRCDHQIRMLFHMGDYEFSCSASAYTHELSPEDFYLKVPHSCGIYNFEEFKELYEQKGSLPIWWDKRQRDLKREKKQANWIRDQCRMEQDLNSSSTQETPVKAWKTSDGRGATERRNGKNKRNPKKSEVKMSELDNKELLTEVTHSFGYNPFI